MSQTQWYIHLRAQWPGKGREMSTPPKLIRSTTASLPLPQPYAEASQNAYHYVACSTNSKMCLWKTHQHLISPNPCHSLDQGPLVPIQLCSTSIFLQLYLKPAVHISFFSSLFQVFSGRPFLLCVAEYPL